MGRNIEADVLHRSLVGVRLVLLVLFLDELVDPLGAPPQHHDPHRFRAWAPSPSATVAKTSRSWTVCDPKRCPTMRTNAGMRDDPPVRRTWDTSAAATDATSSARSIASETSANDGPSSSSNRPRCAAALTLISGRLNITSA